LKGAAPSTTSLAVSTDGPRHSDDPGDCAALLHEVLVQGCKGATDASGGAATHLLCGLSHSIMALLAVLQARGTPLALLQPPAGARTILALPQGGGGQRQPAAAAGGSRLTPFAPEEAARGAALARAIVRTTATIIAAMQEQGRPDLPGCEQCLWQLFMTRLELHELGGGGGAGAGGGTGAGPRQPVQAGPGPPPLDETLQLQEMVLAEVEAAQAALGAAGGAELAASRPQAS
jgi:hypothetical protein